MSEVKELAIRRDIEGWYDVYFVGGGVLPRQLSGIYTKRVHAQRAIDSYIPKRPKPKIKPKTAKVTTDGKDKTSTS